QVEEASQPGTWPCEIPRPHFHGPSSPLSDAPPFLPPHSGQAAEPPRGQLPATSVVTDQPVRSAHFFLNLTSPGCAGGEAINLDRMQLSALQAAMILRSSRSQSPQLLAEWSTPPWR